jgi:hypothetical protein
MEHRSLTRLPDYEWDSETARRWRLSLLPLTVVCIGSLASAVACFFFHLFVWTTLSVLVFLVSAFLAIRAPFRSLPVSLRSGKRMTRYRNSDTRKKEFEILFLDEESKTYFTHTVLYKGDADFRD